MKISKKFNLDKAGRKRREGKRRKEKAQIKSEREQKMEEQKSFTKAHCLSYTGLLLIGRSRNLL
jgi:hypothetical protein